jgi:hypothetical protein
MENNQDKIKIGLCYIVDKMDCDPGYRPLGLFLANRKSSVWNLIF